MYTDIHNHRLAASYVIISKSAGNCKIEYNQDYNTGKWADST